MSCPQLWLWLLRVQQLQQVDTSYYFQLLNAAAHNAPIRSLVQKGYRQYHLVTGWRCDMTFDSVCDTISSCQSNELNSAHSPIKNTATADEQRVNTEAALQQPGGQGQRPEQQKLEQSSSWLRPLPFRPLLHSVCRALESIITFDLADTLPLKPRCDPGIHDCNNPEEEEGGGGEPTESITAGSMQMVVMSRATGSSTFVIENVCSAQK